MRSRFPLGALALLLPPLILLGVAAFFPIGYLFWHLLFSYSNWLEAWQHMRSAGVGSLLHFTLWQAFWSTFVSLAGAFPVAWALAGRDFPGRRFLLGLSILPFALPSIVVAFAFVIVFGNSGYIVSALRPLGFSPSLLYNPWAVVAAHAFFNLPFCVRALVIAWESIPSAQFRASLVMGFSAWRRFAIVELPHLLKPALNVSLLTFGYCLGSFGVVLVLGGRPEFSTLEVGIYQFIRYDFDIQGASLLAALQLLLTLSAALFYRVSVRAGSRHFAGQPAGRPLRFTSRMPWGAWIPLALYSIFLALPLGGIAVDGLRHLPRGDFLDNLVQALATSLSLAFVCGIGSAVLAFLFVRGTLMLSVRWKWLAGGLQELVWILVGVSPTVMALCWLLLLRGDPFTYAWWAVLAIHVAGTLPVSVRILLPPLESLVRDSTRSADVLGLSVWKRLWRVEVPALRSSLLLAAAVAFAYSFGEVAAASVFSGGSMETVPLLIFKLMGAYRFADAASLSLLLALVCAGVSFVAEGRRQ